MVEAEEILGIKIETNLLDFAQVERGRYEMSGVKSFEAGKSSEAKLSEAVELFVADMHHLSNGVEALTRSCRGGKEGKGGKGGKGTKKEKEKEKEKVDEAPMLWALETATTMFTTSLDHTDMSSDVSSHKGWDEGVGLGPAVDILTAGVRLLSGANLEDIPYSQ